MAPARAPARSGPATSPTTTSASTRSTAADPAPASGRRAARRRRRGAGEGRKINPTAAPLTVVAGVLRNTAGEVLINQRSKPARFAGQWEFPGGKVDPGETLHAALARELAEELDIAVLGSRPLISLTHAYPHATVRLNVRTVTDYRGTPRGAEGQAIQWLRPDALRDVDFLEANGPIINAVRLPPYYLITDTQRYGREHTLRRLETLLAERECIVQVREKQMTAGELAAFSRQVIDLCTRLNAPVLANADPETALELGFGGVHLSSDRLERYRARPLPGTMWIGASCHDGLELEAARRLGADFAVLGPVAPTASHPDAPAMGWGRFSRICAPAEIPVYALGGMGFTDLERARDGGAQGLAMIRSAWE